MSMYLRYSGEFLSKKGVTWRCDIYQEADAAFDTVGELNFFADEALVIEWESKNMEATVCGSSATVRLFSPGDRTYVDLYSIKPCQVRLDVYREDVLYWSGCLDPEFYEEPYVKGNGYEVSLTFSDFGVLDRIPCTLAGVVTFADVINGAIAASGINCGSVDESMTTTAYAGIGTLEGTTVDAKMAALAVQAGDFYDEDGEACSWLEALEGVCQPMAWRMVQRAGKVWLYDLNGLYTLGSSKEVYWASTDQTLGTNKVCNDITVTFSPYDNDGSLSDEFEYGDETSSVYSNLGNTVDTVVKNGTESVTGIECYSYFDTYEKENVQSTDQYHLIDFTVFISQNTDLMSGLVVQDSGVSVYRPYFFHVTPVLGGKECEGIAYGFYTGGHGSLSSGLPVLKGYAAKDAFGYNSSVTTSLPDGRWLFQTGLMPVSCASPTGNDYYIRLKLSVLFDARYNPFNSDDDNQKGNQEDICNFCHIAYVPVRVELIGSDGDVAYHWTNKTYMTYAENGATVEGTCGEWAEGAGAWDDAWLAYYEVGGDIDEGTPLGGWMTNRQNFGRLFSFLPGGRVYCMTEDGSYRKWRMSPTFENLEDGQYIPLPPAAGSLRVTVGYGVLCSFISTDDYKTSLGTIDPENTYFYKQGCYEKIRWSLYQAPEIDLVSADSSYSVAKIGDVEYTGVASADAKEDLDVSEIVGTVNDDSQHPAARGCILQVDGDPVSGLQLSEMTRAEVTDHPEQLLIGTLHSQYAGRKTKLTGTASVITDGPLCLTDAAQPDGTKFLLTADRQDVIEDESEVELIEFRPDEYEQEEKA